MGYLLGIDCGLTVAKAALYDEGGREVSVARARVPQLTPKPRHVERSMEALWQAVAQAIREALGDRDPREVRGVGATAHGDGLYLLDETLAPIGPGVLSLDSRAHEIVADWEADRTAARALDLTGQGPHASSFSALLAWVQRHEPERFARIAHVLSCKDWIRTCLTGVPGTDRTEASTSFADVRSQEIVPEALDLYGLGALREAMPRVSAPDEIVGTVTRAAAEATGLAEGTPVVAGLHDVTASALGIGGQRAGAVDVIAGTYSINQIVSDRPVTDARWFCRSGIAESTWNAMSISPASSTNYEWMLQTFCEETPDIHARLAAEIDAAATGPLFLPFLYGSPFGPTPSGTLVGLRGWHGRGEVMRAVLEGIAFNHHHHVEALSAGFAFDAVRLTGGVSRNPFFVQLMADVTGLPVLTCETSEAAAWGAALCAGSGAGLWETPFDDPRDLAALTARTEPNAPETCAERYALWCETARALAPIFSKLDT